MASIETKTFHCEGGALYALLAEAHRDDAIRFIVAYQTISDYLDNLCDRSTSLDPEDFTLLHSRCSTRSRQEPSPSQLLQATRGTG